MPVYTYRREDGTTFDFKQKFSDEPLTVDPETGQKVIRMVQATGVIFKGSGFYVTDNKGTRSGSTASPVKSEGETASAETKTETKSEAKSETKSQPSAAAAAAD